MQGHHSPPMGGPHQQYHHSPVQPYQPYENEPYPAQQDQHCDYSQPYHPQAAHAPVDDPYDARPAAFGPAQRLSPQQQYSSGYLGTPANVPYPSPGDISMQTSDAGHQDYLQQYPDNGHEDIPLMPHSNSHSGSAYGQAANMQYHASQHHTGSNYHMVNPQDYEEGMGQIRYGSIPQRQPRRYKTMKRVELFRGNLVLDVPVPAKLLDQCPLKDEREYKYMRYTACTAEPDDFEREGYSLRQLLYEPPRRTELMIMMTMYNEDEELFTRSMYGVMKNIQHLCSRDRSKMWGKDGWKKVVVCIISDGRQKINSRTLAVLAAQGIYQDGVAKNIVRGKPVTAHIYEYTTQIGVDPEMKYKGAEKGLVPVQVIFCLKEKNQKKINSHRWGLKAFGNLLQPNVCVLLDVGTRPGPTSIYHLWKAFDVNSNVGGACGEIVAMKGKYGSSLLNPLVAAQNFEYKMSNILDKPLESVFGYITVLPGAFSAYRFVALQNNEKGDGPLKEYFKGESLEKVVDATLLDKNMYLAEDRVLCWELVSKRGSAWLLHYVKSAYAVTDVPDQVPELISQRRRWLNGSFFAAIHATIKFGYLYRSDHSFIRKLWLHVELVYQIFTQVFAWFGLGNYYISFVILTQSVADPSFGLKGTHTVGEVLRYVYLGLLVMCFLLAMGNRPQGSKISFTFAMTFFALITAYMSFCAVFIAYKGVVNVKDAIEEEGGKFTLSDVFTNAIFRSIVISILATYGLWTLASFLFFEPWHMFTSFIQYILLSPSYINVINVYAFCNTHDVSWGTKGDTKVSTDLGVVKPSEGTTDSVEVDVPSDQRDIDAAYEDARHILAQPKPKEVEKVDIQQRVEDSYKNIRTNVVLSWAITNGALVAAILSTSASNNLATDGTSAKVNAYMAFLLYSVATMALIKFVGSLMYLTVWIFNR